MESTEISSNDHERIFLYFWALFVHLSCPFPPRVKLIYEVCTHTHTRAHVPNILSY